MLRGKKTARQHYCVAPDFAGFPTEEKPAPKRTAPRLTEQELAWQAFRTGIAIPADPLDALRTSTLLGKGTRTTRIAEYKSQSL